jgi:hypothetical protein
MIDREAIHSAFDPCMKKIFELFHRNKLVNIQIHMAWVEDSLVEKYKCG